MFTARISSIPFNGYCVMKLARRSLNWMSVFVTGVAIASLLMPRSSLASEPETKAVADPARTFFAAHCQTCHAGKEPKGDFLVQSLTADFLDKANRERWLAVLEQLKSGAMPPKEKPPSSGRRN